MISMQELRHREEVTTGEALLITYSLIERYRRILANVIRIKTEVPTELEEDTFRSRSDNTDLLCSLQDVLQQMEQELQAIESQLFNQHGS